MIGATIRKEVTTLKAVWNWGLAAGLVSGSFPSPMSDIQTFRSSLWALGAVVRDLARGWPSQMNQQRGDATRLEVRLRRPRN